MANVTVTGTIKYRIVKKVGNKETSQNFVTEEAVIHLSEDNLTLLIAAISGTIAAADGTTE